MDMTDRQFIDEFMKKIDRSIQLYVDWLNEYGTGTDSPLYREYANIYSDLGISNFASIWQLYRYNKISREEFIEKLVIYGLTGE